MAQVNLAALRERQKKMQEKKEGGPSLMIYANKLPEAQDFRILPPSPDANGFYYVDQKGWWVDGKFYVTLLDGIGVDPIQEEIDIARNLRDPDIDALLKARAGNGAAKVSTESRSIMAVLALDVTADNKYAVRDKAAKVFVCKVSLMLEINRIVTAPAYVDQEGRTILDQAKGRNLTLGKTGKGLDTKYTALPHPHEMAMPDAYYPADGAYIQASEGNVTLQQFAQNGLRSEAYLRSVIRNYLYGEPILEEETTTTTTKPAVTRPTAPAVAQKPSAVAAPKPPTITAPPTVEAKPSDATSDTGLIDSIEAELEG